MKRISIAIGSFIVALLYATSLGLDGFLIALNVSVIETATLVIMTLFGKNGNGNNHNQLTPEPESDNPEPNNPEPALTESKPVSR